MTAANGTSNGGAQATRKSSDNSAADAATSSSIVDPPQALPTAGLEQRLQRLKSQSNAHSTALTQKLATSQSGQNLLHLGNALSTLPPDLHHLLSCLHPVQVAASDAEQEQLDKLQRLVHVATSIRTSERRVQQATHTSHLLVDLRGAEQWLRQVKLRDWPAAAAIVAHDDEHDHVDEASLDYAARLEGVAHTSHCLTLDLALATEHVSLATRHQDEDDHSSSKNNSRPNMRTALPLETERAQVLLQLAPRIRKLDTDVSVVLGKQFERWLQGWTDMTMSTDDKDDEQTVKTTPPSNIMTVALLPLLGHVMRALTVLGRGSEVEACFAKHATLATTRSYVSMGQLDAGGARGSCAGLPHLLEALVRQLRAQYGPLLQYAEAVFVTPTSLTTAVDGEEQRPPRIEVDLVTAGVWVPLATSFLADSGIKMAIFSPGIASILQANYTVMDTFLASLAQRLLQSFNDDKTKLSMDQIRSVQQRIYNHPKTADFTKKWNLPIYYQLRFGEYCNRLNQAVDQTQREGWAAEAFSGSAESALQLRDKVGLELALFMELYDILSTLWHSDVILRPLTNRFLRGAVQLIGRVVAFVADGLDGKIRFGAVSPPQQLAAAKPHASTDNGSNGENEANGDTQLPYPSRQPWCWGDSEEDVAAVAWELTILDATLRHDYVNLVSTAVAASDAPSSELQSLVADVLGDATSQINPLVDKAWKERIVDILTKKCSAPLSAVKGVAATYRMTNRPPPTQASPFVATILRPLLQFEKEFTNRIPDRVGNVWKEQIVATVCDRYATAVDELLATVQRTEEALKNRRVRKNVSGGMSDGEKVKLQLYLDYKAFSQHVSGLSLNPDSIAALDKLRELTAEGSQLQSNGS